LPSGQADPLVFIRTNKNETEDALHTAEGHGPQGGPNWPYLL